jgi:hypothetical protein
LLKFFAIDDSSVGRLIASSATDKLIDLYTIAFHADQKIEPTNGISSSFKWYSFPAIKVHYKTGSFKTQ